MTDRAHKAIGLLDIAIDTYAREILPGLPKDKRYTGAMVANALGIAQRRLSEPDPDKALLQRFGAETLAEAARAIRARDVTGPAGADLQQALLTYVEQELQITNPRFLERRRKWRGT